MKSQTPAFRRVTLLLVLLFLLSFFPGSPARAVGIRYVAPGEFGACTSWADACDLQIALTGAIPGDEIWVKAGTYYPTEGADRLATFQLKTGVALYGGFAGTETNREERDWVSNISILSGNIHETGIGYDDSYHVVTGAENAILDGFTIMSGEANGGYPNDRGGGIYTHDGEGYLELTHLVIAYNQAEFGGGLYSYHSSPILKQVTFIDNFAYSGGGIMSEWDADGMGYVLLDGVTFMDNWATYGGGMSNNVSSPTIVNVTFYNNYAAYGGAIWNTYGGIADLAYSTFSNNSASIAGGAIYYEGYESRANFQIDDTIFWGNTAPSGKQIDTDLPYSFVFNHDIVQGYTGDPLVITEDPMLGPIGNHGGFTQTLPIIEGSSAFNTGVCVSYSDIDQRGIPRPQYGDCDIGAFEVYRDMIAPQIDSFTIPAVSNNPAAIPILTFTASDDMGVVGYIVTATNKMPGPDDPWTDYPPTDTSWYPEFSELDGYDGMLTLYPWVYDTSGNVSYYPDPPSIRIDSVHPVVESITLLDDNPIPMGSVRFSVVFSEPVTGVDAVDFLVSKTGGIAGESVTDVTGGSTEYTVTVNTGIGSGTIQLVIPSGATITDLLDNPLADLPFTDGDAYFIEWPYHKYFPILR